MSSVPPPLTQTTAAGIPYVRRPDVTAEIGQILATATSSWSPDGLESETLVHLLRVLCKRGGEENLLGRFVHRLGRHVARIAKDVAKGFDPTTTDEIILSVGKDIVALVFAESATRQSEFLEVSFRVAVKRRTLNQVEKCHNHPRQRQLVSADGETNPLESVADDGPSPEESVIAAEESELAPERIRRGLSRPAELI